MEKCTWFPAAFGSPRRRGPSETHPFIPAENMSDLRYPIGRFVLEGEITAARREGWIGDTG